MYVLERRSALRKGMRLVPWFFFGACEEEELTGGCRNRKGRKKSSSLGTKEKEHRGTTICLKEHKGLVQFGCSGIEAEGSAQMASRREQSCTEGKVQIDLTALLQVLRVLEVNPPHCWICSV